MATFEEQKEFALSQLAPYYADPTTCGYNKKNASCEYLTPDGKMCVAGKNMINPQEWHEDKGIEDILAENENKQEGLFKPEVVGILNVYQWGYMQRIHDNIAVALDEEIALKGRINGLGLFTFEELVERAASLKKVE